MNFNIRFGLIWTAFTTLFLFICLFAQEDVQGNKLLALISILLFEAIGIYILAKGIKQAVADKNTEKYGEFVYGKILRISNTGSYENGRAELKAQIIAYIPGDGTTRFFDEIIGFNERNYSEGQYVVLKHYEDDVNINLVVDRSKVPINVIEQIDGDNTNTPGDYPNNNWTYSESPELNNGNGAYSSRNLYGTTGDYGYSYDEIPNEKARKAINFVTNNHNKISGISDIIGGVIWILLILGFFWLPQFFEGSTPTTYFKNGVQVTKEEFYTMDPFLMVFILFGFIPIISGILKMCKKDK